MKKTFFLLFTTWLATVSVHAQNIKERIDKQAKSHTRKEHEARADIYIIDKKKITDSTALKSSKLPATKKRKYTYRKKPCRK